MAGNSLLLAAVFGRSIAATPTGFQAIPLKQFFFAVGLVLLVVAFSDLFWTTLWDDKGAGPLSSRLMTTVWHGLRRFDSEQSSVLSAGGPLILWLIIVTWVGLIWAGWTFVFASHETALIHTRSSEPVTWIGRIYFVAQAMFTMGNGDFYPPADSYQFAAALTTASGLLSVTLIVAYVVSVLQGVTAKRSFANSIMGVEDRGGAFIARGWNGDGFNQFDLVLDALSSELGHLAAQHKIYPILHYYRSEKRRNSQVVAVAVFDEALTLLRFGVPTEHSPNEALLESARSNAESYLEAFTDTIEPADRAPPPPDLDRLREADIPTVSDEEFADALDDLDERRRQLLAVVRDSGRSWPSEDTN